MELSNSEQTILSLRFPLSLSSSPLLRHRCSTKSTTDSRGNVDVIHELIGRPCFGRAVKIIARKSKFVVNLTVILRCDDNDLSSSIVLVLMCASPHTLLTYARSLARSLSPSGITFSSSSILSKVVFSRKKRKEKGFKFRSERARRGSPPFYAQHEKMCIFWWVWALNLSCVQLKKSRNETFNGEAIRYYHI